MGRYTRELVRAMAHLPQAPQLGLFGWTIASARSDAQEQGLSGSTARLSRLRFPSRWFPQLCAWTGRGAEDWVGGAQVWHHTQPNLLPVRRAIEVATIFDLIYMRSNDFLSPAAAERMTRSARETLARSRLVFVPTHFVLGELVRVMGADPARIRVTRLGADHAWRNPALRAQSLGQRRAILTLSRVDRRKNHVAMLRAFEILAREDQQLRWIVAGPDGHGAEDFAAALAHSPARHQVERHAFVPEQQLAQLWSRSAAFWFTSLDEGFGLPPLEAMGLGLPTFASHCASLPEVLGDGAQLLHPEDTEGLAHATRPVLRDRELWLAHSQRGLRWAQAWTWERCAQETLRGYAEVLA